MDALINDQFYSVLFIAIGMMLILLEMFIPSAGILGVCAAVSAGIGIYGLWQQGRTVWATGSLIAVLGFTGMMFAIVIRRLQLGGTLAPQTTTSVDERIAPLDGKEGRTLTALRPAGLALIDDKRVDVVASGKFIERDRPVRVVETSGNRVVVREIAGSDS